MRRCIIDNSTITAADRLLGHIQVGNYHQIDGDIAAFENLIQAILFHDELFFLNDYKKEFREKRRSRYGFLTPLQPDAPEYIVSKESARGIVQKMAPAIRGSRFSDADFAPFIEMLKANMAFSWRMHSSVYWLTVSMLTHEYGKEIHKYSKVWEAIFAQLQEKESNSGKPQHLNNLLLNERDGTQRDISSLRNSEAIDRKLEQFLASLSWLSFRTTSYSILGQLSGMDVILHPIRHAFRANVLHRHLGLGTDAYSSIMTAMNDQLKATTQEILHTTQPIVTRIELPYFSAHLVKKTGNVRKVIEAALELRAATRFKDARSMLADLQTTDQTNYVKKANKIILELHKTAQFLKAEYGVGDKQGVQVGPMIAVANAALNMKIPNLGTLPLPGFIKKHLKRRNFRGIFRSIVEDLTAIERLGSIRTKLAAAADKSTAGRHNAPTENPRFLGIDSSVRRWQ